MRVFVYETTSTDPACVDAALVSQGRSMRNAMLADLAALDDVAVTCAVGGAAVDAVVDDLPPGVQATCRPVGVPPQDFLRGQVTAHDLAWVVAPETAGVLACLRRAVADRQWLGCSRKAIAIAGSKRATAARLSTAGIATPMDVAPGFPGAGWVVKPDDGCGAAGVRRHADSDRALADCEERRGRQEEAVIERWIEGEPHSITLLCGAGKVELLACNRQHLATDESGGVRFDGVSIAPVPCDRRARLDHLARRILDALPGLGGIVGVDLVWHPLHGPVVIEVNPRVTCAYQGLSAMLGRNIAAEMLALHRHDWPDAVPARVAPAP